MKTKFSRFALLLFLSVLFVHQGTSAFIQVNEGQFRSSALRVESIDTASSSPLFQLDSGAVFTLTGGATFEFPGSFQSVGQTNADSTSTLIFSGDGNDTVSGIYSFGNLWKKGAGRLTIANPITVFDSLNIFSGQIITGHNTIHFGPNGFFNGHPFGGGAIGPDTLLVSGFEDFLAQSLDGWNLLSVPVGGSNLSPQVLYPAAISNAYVYQHGYQTRDTVSHGTGFWLKFTGNQLYEVVGSFLTKDTLRVFRGWNIIGTIAGAIPVNSIIQLPESLVQTGYFGYANSYSPADSLREGNGYWVKCSADGKLVLSSAGGVIAEKSLEKGAIAEAAMLKTMNSLTLRGAGNISSVVYFGEFKERNVDVSQFELPPLPPSGGGQDLRFASNRYMQPTGSANRAIEEYPLMISANQPNAQLTWQVQDNTGTKYTLVETDDRGRTVNKPIGGDGTITIDPKKKYALRVEPLPAAYALYQNYPNPFNPTTTIRFDLPEQAVVSLDIFNVLGQEVKRLLNGQTLGAGNQGVELQAGRFASGVYFYRLDAVSVSDPAKHFVQTLKMLLMK